MNLELSKIQINAEYESLVPRVTPDEYQTIKHSIQQHGIREPVVINDKNILIDGHTRIQIAKELLLKEVPYRVETYKDQWEEEEAVIAYNLERRQLNLMQLGILGHKIEQLEKAKAEERQKQTQPKEGVKIGSIEHKSEIIEKTAIYKEVLNSTPPSISPKTPSEPIRSKPIPALEKGKSVEIAAKKVGISADTQKKVDKIIEKAKESPLIKKEMDDAIAGKISVNKAFSAIKKEERKADLIQQQADINSGKIELPKGLYEIIVIDPPWPYGTEYDPEGRRAANPYPEMSLVEIEKLKLPLTEDCIVFLWTTHKFMRHSFKLLDAWGCRDVAIITWAKDRMGLGTWLRSQSEFCIMAVKGKPKINLTNQTTILNGPLREHSRKPDEFYAMVDNLCIGRKLDYFSRQKRPGWDVMGNDVGKF